MCDFYVLFKVLCFVLFFYFLEHSLHCAIILSHQTNTNINFILTHKHTHSFCFHFLIYCLSFYLLADQYKNFVQFFWCAINSKLIWLNYDRTKFWGKSMCNFSFGSYLKRITSENCSLEINENHFEFIPHPSYSQDLAPGNYQLLPILKRWLQEKRFESNEKVISQTNSYIFLVVVQIVFF